MWFHRSVMASATIPADAAKILGLASVGAEVVLMVDQVNSDGSVVVRSSGESEEEGAPSAPAPASLPPELNSMLGT